MIARYFVLLISLIVLGKQLSMAQASLNENFSPKNSQALLQAHDSLYFVIDSLCHKQINIENTVHKLSQETNRNNRNLQLLSKKNDTLRSSIENLQTECKRLYDLLASDKESFNKQIKLTNDFVTFNHTRLTNRTVWGSAIIIITLTIIFIISYHLARRIKTGASSIDEVRKTQDMLQTVQAKMQEESIGLDNKLLELIEKQMTEKQSNTTTQDHSLALKVADEIVRIEMNLSHMDATVKGYKQLTKAVQRIKDNFNANGYEITDMLGKTYNIGMKVVANFIPDEKLPFGSQIITGIIKPQINYNGQMIQAAQITVSQNI
ncbi:hypothetical protein [Odoribacter lunatus]|uniref:hypothetical protein n=1 Tax=Odoribacter lunatus TaxID=2941335 RepID=UPI00203B61D5|nr:hypothetical protein [Odoribacter lunatus]